MKTSRQSGFSLAELLVAVGIGCVATGISYKTISDFNSMKKAQEIRGRAVSAMDIASKQIRVTIPELIPEVTGADGRTQPLAELWSCSGSGCTMTVRGGRIGATPLQILNVSCQDYTDSRLAAANIHTISVDTTVTNGTCVTCAQGQGPRMRINIYKFANALNPPSLVGTKNIPEAWPPKLDQMLAMGACFEAPATAYNTGTAAAPVNVNVYNRWTLTLIPVFLKGVLPTNATTAQTNGLLTSVPDRIMMSTPRTSGGNIVFIPTP